MGNKTPKQPYTELTQDDINNLKKNTNFSEKEIRQWHKGFVRDCQGDKLKEEKFIEIFRKYYISDDKRSEAFCNYVFGLFNKNKDGVIDFEEFLQIIDFSTQGKTDERLKLIFHMYDTLGSDGIDEKELTELLTAMYNLLGEKNRTGINDPKRRAEEIMKKADGNKDTKLTLDEFLIACKDDERLMKLLCPFSTKTAENTK
ncbi:hypothetical protein I4U23_023202 [Adineta vaga]|nr:hypothetical protein I4U23_023202 [Adineta vaga]